MKMGEEILHQIVVFVDPAHIALLSIDYAHQEPLKAKLGTTVISVQLHSLPGIDEPAPIDIVPAAAAAPILGDAVTPVGATPIVFDVLSVVFAAPFADALLAECPEVFVASSVAEVVAPVVAAIVFDALFVDMLPFLVVSTTLSLPEVVAPIVAPIAFDAPFVFDIPIAFDTPVAFDALIAFDVPAADAMLAVAIQPAI